ncbi:hypothetical protein B0H16DRAFT_1319067 [Mycena metata]|uniref:T6SS Phospholipase effector Tle1-like catalytic domain-containing protein n=1 Tax=Mycena metata TaxID=1033252 RepID=A0AAD7N8H2_9AGAR|nr:hypothetical protein B0H16DRAFT_1319067 [Mycena metata]
MIDKLAQTSPTPNVSATVPHTPYSIVDKQADAVAVDNPNASATAQRTQSTTAQTVDGKTVSDDVPRPQGPPRKCGCACKPECDCKCTCACLDHCVCRREPCTGKCGSRRSRNLVVSLDGTSNQFGVHNTNVVELHSRIIVDNATVDEQLTYYNCGIGTYVPNHRKTYKYLRQRLDNVIDLAIAWNFEDIVQKAYRWLSNVYQAGDKIFLIGFSRGAYQARTVAAMIEKVGLVNAGNQELIPYAYEIYSERHKDAANGQAEAMATTFKNTFSRTVKVHFIGVWDTVSSVGIAREKPLPLTGSAKHVCVFRHALALDEARVKFLPEYVDGGSSNAAGLRQQRSDKPADQSGLGPKGAPNPGNVKEVWFAGTHSDIGGGLKNNLNLNLSSVPLLWMENEATSAGLKLQPRPTGGGWNWDDLRDDTGHDSMSLLWSMVEQLPIARLSYKNADEVTRYVPHRIRSITGDLSPSLVCLTAERVVRLSPVN